MSDERNKLSSNSNEDAVEDSPSGDRTRLATNTNETADDEVAAHGQNLNTNEDAAEGE